MPGAGKTTLAALVAQRINTLCPTSIPTTPLAIAIPMDGFHYTRRHLATLPDPVEAMKRRGAAFTFDADGFIALVRRLAAAPVTETVLAPAFAHETKDPVPDAIAVPPQTRVVLVEGNYCALDREPWRAAAALMTRLWYVDAPPDVTQPRIAARHLAAGIARTEAEALERARGSDELNAQDIRDNLLKVDRVIAGVAAMRG